MFFRAHDSNTYKENLDIPYLSPELNRIFKDLQELEYKKMLEVLDDLPLEQATLLAVEIVGPRVLKIVGFEKEDVCIDMIGCQGEKTDEQFDVANNMRKKDKIRKADLKMLNGDNAYPRGALSPFDEVLYDCFEKPYCPSLKEENSDNNNFELSSKENELDAWLTGLGNHDGNYQNLYNAAKTRNGYGLSSRPLKGEELEVNEAAYTFRPKRKFKKVSEIVDLLLHDEVDIKDLRQIGWIMPYFYMSYIIGNVQFFFINSNSYLRDYLVWQEGKSTKRNQAAWVDEKYHASAKEGRALEKVFFMHNFLLSQGKRVKKSDTDHYLSEEQIAQLQKLLNTNSKFYSDLHVAAFRKQGYMPITHIAAHDHMQTQISSPDIFQLIVGSGGGLAQQRKAFNLRVGYHFSGHGHMRLKFSLIEEKPELFFEFITLPIPKLGGYAHQVCFSRKSNEPIQEKIANPLLVELRTTLLKAANAFLSNPYSYLELTRKQPEHNSSILWKPVEYLVKTVTPYFSTSDADVINDAHHLIAYLNQPVLPPYEEVRYFINTFLSDPTFLFILNDIDEDVMSILEVPTFSYSPQLQ